MVDYCCNNAVPALFEASFESCLLSISLTSVLTMKPRMMKKIPRAPSTPQVMIPKTPVVLHVTKYIVDFYFGVSHLPEVRPLGAYVPEAWTVFTALNVLSV